MAFSKIFQKVEWHNDAPPAIDEDNLNRIENAIDEIDDRVVDLDRRVSNPTPQLLPVRFYDQTGATLLCKDFVLPGETAEYYGPTPEKENTEDLFFEFVGWSSEKNTEIEEQDILVNIDASKNVYASMKSTLIPIVRFMNWDGDKELYRTTTSPGENVECNLDESAIYADDITDNLIVQFKGWSTTKKALNEEVDVLKNIKKSTTVYPVIDFTIKDVDAVGNVSWKNAKSSEIYAIFKAHIQGELNISDHFNMPPYTRINPDMTSATAPYGKATGGPSKGYEPWSAFRLLDDSWSGAWQGLYAGPSADQYIQYEFPYKVRMQYVTTKRAGIYSFKLYYTNSLGEFVLINQDVSKFNGYDASQREVYADYALNPTIETTTLRIVVKGQDGGGGFNPALKNILIYGSKDYDEEIEVREDLLVNSEKECTTMLLSEGNGQFAVYAYKGIEFYKKYTIKEYFDLSRIG